MITPDQIGELPGVDVKTQGGGQIGTVAHVFVDEVSGQPSWVAVSTGALRREHVLPLSNAFLDSEGVLVTPLDEDAIGDSPEVGSDQALSVEDEDALYRHYGMTPGEPPGGETSGPGDRPSDAPLAQRLKTDHRTGSRRVAD